MPFIRDGLFGAGEMDVNNKGTASPLKGVDILEVGCGAGLLTEVLMEKYNEYSNDILSDLKISFSN